jgi:hypothetical protein
MKRPTDAAFGHTQYWKLIKRLVLYNGVVPADFPIIILYNKRMMICQEHRYYAAAQPVLCVLPSIVRLPLKRAKKFWRMGTNSAIPEAQNYQVWITFYST